jgi:hypothetical protein
MTTHGFGKSTESRPNRSCSMLASSRSTPEMAEGLQRVASGASGLYEECRKEKRDGLIAVSHHRVRRGAAREETQRRPEPLRPIRSGVTGSAGWRFGTGLRCPGCSAVTGSGAGYPCQNVDVGTCRSSGSEEFRQSIVPHGRVEVVRRRAATCKSWFP